MGMLSLLRTILIVSLFYSVSVTLLTYALSGVGSQYVTPYAEIAGNIDMENVRDEIQGGISSELNIPIVEMGALVFYSGNIIVDLMLNFFFAIPQMIGLLVHGFTVLFNMDTYVYAIIELFAGVMVTVLYFIGLIELVLGIRRGRVIA